MASTASTTVGDARLNDSSTSTAGSSSIISGPPRFPYLFRNIAEFPRRLIHPPSPSIPRVGTVRSLTLKPCYQVLLEDVLNGRHLPPLGRKEFEDFLYFKEFSVENLYFHVWFLNYQSEYNSSTLDDYKPNPKLAMSYTRAKQTFFTPGSPWELNLPQRTLQQLLQPQTPHRGHPTHPHPSVFAEVRFEVNNYLNDSLTRFVVQNGGNAGRHRGLFAVFLGLLLIGAGLVPIILSSLTPGHTWQQRLVRLSSLPALWFGFATLVMGLHGVCILIFLFGDARQLYPYELCRPAISSPISCTPSFAMNPNLIANQERRYPPHRRHSAVPVTISPQKERHVVHLPETASASHTHMDSVSKTDYEQAGPLDFGLYGESEDDAKRVEESPVAAACAVSTPTTATTAATRVYPDVPLAFDFDALPIPPTMRVPEWKASDNSSPTTASSFTAWHQNVDVASSKPPYGGAPSSTAITTYESTNEGSSTLRQKYEAIKNWEWNKERTVFSPLTRVLDPVVTRTQWEIVMRSCLFALAISLVIALGSLGLP